MFWAYGNFGRMETMCAKSFINNGYDLQVWTYGRETINIPGANTRDAREILPESMVFLNRAGSYAGFSDLFRYSVLCACGGLYVDTDVVALKPASALPSTYFVATERRHEGGLALNGNVICNPRFKHGNLIDLARVYAERFPKSDITWSEIGPSLLTAIVQSYPLHGFEIHPPEFANYIDFWNCPHALLNDEGISIPNSAHFLHLYNDMWRRAGIDKNAKFGDMTPYEQLINRFCQ